MSAILTVRSLNKTYHAGGQTIHVLRDLDMDVAAGEMVAIVGASGVGKVRARDFGVQQHPAQPGCAS